MHSVPTIETERLILRPYRRDDFGPYSTLFADPEVTRFIGGVPFSREQAWTRFLRQVGMWHYFGFGFFALQDRETGQFIGEAGFHEEAAGRPLFRRLLPRRQADRRDRQRREDVHRRSAGRGALSSITRRRSIPQSRGSSSDRFRGGGHDRRSPAFR